jgi:hypothetical protein
MGAWPDRLIVQEGLSDDLAIACDGMAITCLQGHGRRPGRSVTNSSSSVSHRARPPFGLTPSSCTVRTSHLTKALPVSSDPKTRGHGGNPVRHADPAELVIVGLDVRRDTTLAPITRIEAEGGGERLARVEGCL